MKIVLLPLIVYVLYIRIKSISTELKEKNKEQIIVEAILLSITCIIILGLYIIIEYVMP